MTDQHEHEWLLHQPPDASLAPDVGICRGCGAIDFDWIAAWNADRMLTATVLARAERDEAKAEAEGLRRVGLELNQTLVAWVETAGQRDEEAARLRAAIPGDIDPVHVRPMLRLLGPARMVLDQLAEALGGQAGPWRDEAADMAQRIVDWIGHPTTDEPAWATLPCEHGDACRTCRHCLARVRAGYRPGLVDGAPVIDEQRETGST